MDYDAYWQERDGAVTSARSRERAQVALDILGPANGRRLLELGCGPGWALELFAAAGFQTQGLDVSELAVNAARGRGLDASQVDLEADDWVGSHCRDAPDVIVALEVLEHLANPLRVLEGARDALADDGCLLVSLPNELALPARLRVLCGRLPFGGHDDPHLRHFDRHRAQRLFRAALLRVAKEAPINLLPPRWRAARVCVAPLVRLLPGSFALTMIYQLRKESDHGGE